MKRSYKPEDLETEQFYKDLEDNITEAKSLLRIIGEKLDFLRESISREDDLKNTDIPFKLGCYACDMEDELEELQYLPKDIKVIKNIYLTKNQEEETKC